jgi:DNA adenine methylase
MAHKINLIIDDSTKSDAPLLELCTPKSQSEINVQKPFLKWAGRKTKLVAAIKQLLPPEGKRFIEPFVGSGAVFINTSYPKSILSDSNKDIVNLFSFLREDTDNFIRRCQRLFIDGNNTAEKFNEFRDEFNNTTDLVRRAAIFVYLNRHCFNGLCRYNKNGKFNVPFGRYDSPYFPRHEMLAFAKKLKTATLKSQDFRQSIGEAKRGDVIYCDPPYVPLSDTANFTDYASGGFTLQDQQDLARYSIAAAQRGATVLISNHDTEVTRKLYNNAAKIMPVLVSRTISCDGKNRNKVKELLAVFTEVL